MAPLGEPRRDRRVGAGDARNGAPPATERPSAFASLLEVAKLVAGVGMVIGASAGVAWVARRHVLTSPRFALATIAVDGFEHEPESAVVAASGLTRGSNVFAADLDAARARLLADPWIVDATLARRLPGTVSIHIVEHKAAALVAAGDTWIAGPDGAPFKKLAPGDPYDLPVVTGLRAEDLARDPAGSARTVRTAVGLAGEYDAGPLSQRAPLEEIHVDADGGFTLRVGWSGVELAIGGPPFRRKLEEAARVFAEVDKRGATAEAVMLDDGTRPDRVVVRVR
jgi:cell division protein FtsQ